MVSERGGIKARGARIGIAAAAVLLLVTGVAAAGGSHDRFTPGAAGAGDPYFPLDGNGGYDAKHYLLDLKYNPATDVLEGTATIRARATQNLSRFNLDFDGMTVQSIEIDGRRASWRRDGGELIVTPRDGHPQRRELHDRGQVPRRPRDARGRQRVHPHRRRRARSSASPTWPRPGTRSTTIRATRPRTRSR